MISILLWILLLEKLVTVQPDDSHDLRPPDIDHDYRFAWDKGGDQPQLHYVPVYMPPSYLNSYQRPPPYDVHLNSPPPPPSRDRPERKQFLGIPFLPGPEALMAASGAVVMQKAISASVPHVPTVVGSLFNLNKLFGFRNRQLPFMRSRAGKDLQFQRPAVSIAPRIPISSKYINSGEVYMSDRSENLTEPVKFVNSDFVGIQSPGHRSTSDSEPQPQESKLLIITEDLDEGQKEESKRPRRLRKLRRKTHKPEHGDTASNTIGTVQDHEPDSYSSNSESVSSTVSWFSEPMERMQPMNHGSHHFTPPQATSMTDGNNGYQISVPNDGVVFGNNNLLSTTIYPSSALTPVLSQMSLPTVQWAQENPLLNNNSWPSILSANNFAHQMSYQPFMSQPFPSPSPSMNFHVSSMGFHNAQPYFPQVPMWHPPQIHPNTNDISHPVPPSVQSFSSTERPFIPSPQIDESWVPETVKLMSTHRPTIENAEGNDSEEEKSNESVNQSPELLTDEIRLAASAQRESDEDRDNPDYRSRPPLPRGPWKESYWRYLKWKNKLHHNATNDSIEKLLGADNWNSESKQHPYRYQSSIKSSEPLPPTPLKLIQQMKATASTLKSTNGLGSYASPSREPPAKLRVTRTSRPSNGARNPKSQSFHSGNSNQPQNPKFIVDIKGNKHPIAPTLKNANYINHNLPLVQQKPVTEDHDELSSGYKFPDNHQLPTQTIYYNSHLDNQNQANNQDESNANHQYVKQVVTYRQQPKPTKKIVQIRNKPTNYRVSMKLPKEVQQYLKEVNGPQNHPENNLNYFIDTDALDQHHDNSQKVIFNDLQQHLRQPNSNRGQQGNQGHRLQQPSPSQITVNALPIKFNSPYDPPKMMIQDDELAGMVNVGGKIQAVRLMKEITPFNYRQMLKLDEGNTNDEFKQMIKKFKMEDIMSQQKTMGFPKNFVMDSVKKGKPFKLMKIRVGR